MDDICIYYNDTTQRYIDNVMLFSHYPFSQNIGWAMVVAEAECVQRGITKSGETQRNSFILQTWTDQVCSV